MSKKVIIISIIAVLVIAGAIVGVLAFLRMQTPAAKQVTTSELTPDLSKDYGACDLLEKASIKTALGKSAENLQGPNNVGRVYVTNGDESQICVYSFITGGTIDNTFNQNNGFSAEVYVFKNAENKAAYLEVNKPESLTSVPNIGDSATFATVEKAVSSDESVPKLKKFILTVYSGLQYYTYTISEQSDVAVFTEASAKEALVTIASSATYND